MGRPGPARLHRAPPELGAHGADLRRRAGPPGAARAAPGLGQPVAQRHRIRLEPLADERCASCSRAWCPGSRTTRCAPIVERAEGIPLYAVETVRMLLDRELARRQRTPLRSSPATWDARRGRDAPRARSRPASTPTRPEDRVAAPDASVLGQSFTLEALAAVSGREPAELERPPRPRSCAASC